ESGTRTSSPAGRDGLLGRVPVVTLNDVLSDGRHRRQYKRTIGFDPLDLTEVRVAESALVKVSPVSPVSPVSASARLQRLSVARRCLRATPTRAEEEGTGLRGGPPERWKGKV